MNNQKYLVETWFFSLEALPAVKKYFTLSNIWFYRFVALYGEMTSAD